MPGRLENTLTRGWRSELMFLPWWERWDVRKDLKYCCFWIHWLMTFNFVNGWNGKVVTHNCNNTLSTKHSWLCLAGSVLWIPSELLWGAGGREPGHRGFPGVFARLCQKDETAAQPSRLGTNSWCCSQVKGFLHCAQRFNCYTFA